MNNKIEHLLYKQLDGKLTPEEIKFLNEAVDKDPRISKERENIMQMRELVSSSKIDEFKPFFETRVIHKINNSANQFSLQELFPEVLANQFRKILVPAMIVILAIATYNLSSADAINFNSLMGIPEVSLADSVDPINYLGLE